MIELFLDTETHSATPIKHGTYRYAEDAEVMIVTYAIGDGPVHDMDMTRGDPADVLRLRNLVSNADVIICHNTMFDRNVMRLGTLGIEIPREKFRCSMVKALLHGLPGGLDKLCDILGVPTDLAKHKTGRALIHLFCKPIPFTHAIPRANYPTVKAWKEAIEEAKKHWQGRATRETHPVQWAQFIEYARADIPAMREVWRRLPSWNYGETGAGALERDLWHLDQKINDRGVCIDLPLVHAAIRATNDEQTRLKSRVVAHTDGYVEAATQRDRMLEFIFTEYGIGLADLTKSTVAKLIEKEGTPPELVELLQLRAQASQTSTAKYNAFARGTSADGRLRGMLQFSGAARTRRDAGRTVQLQNLPSRGLLPQSQIEIGIEALLGGCEDLAFDNIMLLTSSAIRSVIVAPPGKKLVVSDLANIEGRGLAWLAGEEWKLQAFRDFDTILGYDDLTGEALRAGPDLYKLAYAKAFRITVEMVTKFGRSIGKVMELGLGYAGGINAFVTFALVYGIDLEEMADTAWATLPPEMVAEAENFIEWLEDKGSRWPMSRRAVIVCEVFKRLWREAHPMTVQLWAEMELGFKRATNNPGQTYRYRGFAFRRDGMWLRIRLPSGRYLCYPSPQVDADGQCSFMGVDQFTRKWTRVKTYGGKLTENCIAEGTPVLTGRGWVPIERVSSADTLWDGEAWVPHNGCIYRGKQVVSAVFRVEMTADHRVLTTEGWRHASSCEGHYRAPCRLPDSGPVRGEQREEVPMGSALRLRSAEEHRPIGFSEARQTGGFGVLRMQAPRDHRQEAHAPRDVTSPSLRGLAQHAGPLPLTYTPGLQKLWRAGYQGLRQLGGVLRELLGGYGADISGGRTTEAEGQHAGVFCRELPVGYTAETGKQPSDEPLHRDTSGPDDGGASGEEVWAKPHHAAVPCAGWLAASSATRAVWDLQDCGPRNRFVVQGADGLPLIVHNCTQSVARDFMFDAMPGIEAAGYEIVLRVHDEVPCYAPDTPEFNAEHLSGLLATNPPWAPDMPLAAAGFEGYRYKKD